MTWEVLLFATALWILIITAIACFRLWKTWGLLHAISIFVPFVAPMMLMDNEASGPAMLGAGILAFYWGLVNCVSLVVGGLVWLIAQSEKSREKQKAVK
ncbi:MAG: hypothetical protein ACRCY3_04865 [Sphingorhabdus sp.]